MELFKTLHTATHNERTNIARTCRAVQHFCDTREPRIDADKCKCMKHIYMEHLSSAYMSKPDDTICGTADANTALCNLDDLYYFRRDQADENIMYTYNILDFKFGATLDAELSYTLHAIKTSKIKSRVRNLDAFKQMLHSVAAALVPALPPAANRPGRRGTKTDLNFEYTFCRYYRPPAGPRQPYRLDIFDIMATILQQYGLLHKLRSNNIQRNDNMQFTQAEVGQRLVYMDAYNISFALVAYIIATIRPPRLTVILHDFHITRPSYLISAVYPYINRDALNFTFSSTADETPTGYLDIAQHKTDLVPILSIVAFYYAYIMRPIDMYKFTSFVRTDEAYRKLTHIKFTDSPPPLYRALESVHNTLVIHNRTSPAGDVPDAESVASDTIQYLFSAPDDPASQLPSEARAFFTDRHMELMRPEYRSPGAPTLRYIFGAPGTGKSTIQSTNINNFYQHVPDDLTRHMIISYEPITYTMAGRTYDEQDYGLSGAQLTTYNTVLEARRRILGRAMDDIFGDTQYTKVRDMIETTFTYFMHKSLSHMLFDSVDAFVDKFLAECAERRINIMWESVGIHAFDRFNMAHAHGFNVEGQIFHMDVNKIYFQQINRALTERRASYHRDEVAIVNEIYSQFLKIYREIKFPYTLELYDYDSPLDNKYRTKQVRHIFTITRNSAGALSTVIFNAQPFPYKPTLEPTFHTLLKTVVSNAAGARTIGGTPISHLGAAVIIIVILALAVVIITVAIARMVATINSAATRASSQTAGPAAI